GQTRTLQQMVVAADDFHHLSSQDTRPSNRQRWIILPFHHGQNDGIALHKNLCGTILRKQLVDRIIEIQAKVRGGIHTAFQQRAGQARRVTDISLYDNVPQNLVFVRRRFALLIKEKRIQSAIKTRKIAQFFAADEVDLFGGNVQALEPAQIAVVTHEVPK